MKYGIERNLVTLVIRVCAPGVFLNCANLWHGFLSIIMISSRHVVFRKYDRNPKPSLHSLSQEIMRVRAWKGTLLVRINKYILKISKIPLGHHNNPFSTPAASLDSEHNWSHDPIINHVHRLSLLYKLSRLLSHKKLTSKLRAKQRVTNTLIWP